MYFLKCRKKIDVGIDVVVNQDLSEIEIGDLQGDHNCIVIEIFQSLHILIRKC